MHLLKGWLLCVPALVLSISSNTRSEFAIQWRSGPITLERKSPEELQQTLNLSRRQDRHLVVLFDQPVNAHIRKSLANAGVVLLNYLGGHAYFASLQHFLLDAQQISQTESLVAVEFTERRWKLHSALVTGDPPPWAIIDETDLTGPTLAVYVLFHSDVSLDPDAVQTARRHSAKVRSRLETVNGLVVEIPAGAVATLADDDRVMWIEPALPPLAPVNDDNRTLIQADVVQEPPYDLDGSGVNVLVYDIGTVSPGHPDFAGRLTVADSHLGYGFHATHVAGTLAGDGSDSGGFYRGMAPGAGIISYGYEFNLVGLPLYTDPGDIEADYTEGVALFNAHLATNSIGTNVCANALFFDCEITGDYGVTSSVIDATVRATLGTPFRVLFANGNERQLTGCARCIAAGVHTPEGYHSTAPPACAKNHITVGAVYSDTDDVTVFSSFGPCDDGRMKPDIVAPGSQLSKDGGVTSTCDAADGAPTVPCIDENGNGYGYRPLQGTSMSAPTAGGLVALLLQDYRVQFPERPDPRNSTIKILLAQGAVDLGNPGPDYQSGFGSIRTQNSIDFMRQRHVYERHVEHGGLYTFLAAVPPESEQLKIILAWDDVPAVPNVENTLINDLDLVVIDPDGAQHFPWTLDPETPGAPAIRTQPDHVNNIEQVVVDSPSPGLWHVQVVGFNVPAGPQMFSIAGTPQLSLDCDANNVPDDQQIADDPSLDCTANGVLDSCEPDCNENGIADSCDIAAGSSEDCDADNVPDDCQSDCNTNDIADTCDIASGLSEDCDGDGLPDECQDTTADCNDNTVWDACDIADGTSSDINSNGIPDDCEEIHRTIHVDDSAPDDPAPGDPLISDPAEDGSALHPFDSIQEAIDAALPSDMVLLADGFYEGLGNTGLSFLGKDIILRSVNGPATCIIDGANTANGFTFADGESSAAVLEGLTIQNCFDPFWGAAINCNGGASPRITNCILRDNHADFGGAVVTFKSSPSLRNCLLYGNTAASGGAVLTGAGGNVAMTGCTFADNAGEFAGGAVAAAGASTSLLNCILWNNTAPESPQLYAENGDEFEVDYSNIQGGWDGPHNLDLDPQFIAPSIEDYRLQTGSPCIDAGDPTFSPLPDEMDIDGQPRILGLYVDMGADETADCNDNGIPDREDIAGGTSADCSANGIPDECEPDCNGNSKADSCDILEGGSEDCSADGVPDECEPDCNGNGFADSCDILDEVSEDCNNNSIPDECDPDCNLNQIPDACEASYVDCNGNGVLDSCDIEDGISSDCSMNGIPDECEADCNDNGASDDCDINGGISIDCDDNGIPDECEQDCNDNGAGDSCDIDDGTSEDCDGNGIPDECDMDCNDNGLPDACEQSADCNDNNLFDECDIALGISPDCDRNGIPDECQADCNENHAPDFCDIADGVSNDCNGNGTPDECEPGGDCNVNNVLDFCELAEGLAADCNQNGIPDDCEPDCNGNSTADSCDISAGVSMDCNKNGIPDECAAWEPDCNRNGVPDDCDISGGSSMDQDNNGVPDECPDLIYVPQTFPTIQEAINVADDGDTIVVAAGTYEENISYLGKVVTVRSVQPKDAAVVAATMIHGTQGESAVFFGNDEGRGSLLTGVTIRNTLGGAVFCKNSSPTIRNCVIRDSMEAIHIEGNSNMLISHCRIFNNGDTGVVVGGGVVTGQISNCEIWGNSSGLGGGIKTAVTAGSALVIRNCTIAHNTASKGGGIYLHNAAGGSTFIEQSILWANEAAYGPQVYATGSNWQLDVSYSAVQDGLKDIGGSPELVIPGPGNIETGPLFAGTLLNNYRLLPTSPAVNAGDPGYVPTPDDETDLDGHSRVQLGRVDMGVYEAASFSDCNDNGAPDWLDVAEGSSEDGDGNGYPDECPPLFVFVDDDAPGDPDPGNPGISDLDENGSLLHPYDSVQEAMNRSAPFETIIVLDGTYYENIDFIGRGLTIRSIDPMNPDVVAATVIDGSARDAPVIAFISGEGLDSVVDGLTITGGSGAREVLGLNSPHAGGGILVLESSATLRRCRIAGNRAAQGGGIAAVSGGLHLIDSVIGNNVVNDEQVGPTSWLGFGAGMMTLDCSVTLQNCRILDNRTVFDLFFGTPGSLYFAAPGAMIMTQQTDITVMIMNSQFRRNHVIDPFEGGASPAGGGIYLQADSGTLDAMIVNSLIADNESGAGAGLILGGYDNLFTLVQGCTIANNVSQFTDPLPQVYWASPVLASNNIIYGNTPEDGSDNRAGPLSGGLVDYFFSNVETKDGSIVPGSGNINSDPKFVDAPSQDYHLLSGSPCIDAGDPDLVFDPAATDIDRHPRIIDGDEDHAAIVDMGADEFVGCAGDVDGNGTANIVDLFALLADWALTDSPADLNHDGTVDLYDLLIVIAGFGMCP